MKQPPDFNDKVYERSCHNCRYSQLKKTGQKVMESGYFMKTFGCIAPLPIWHDKSWGDITELQVVVESTYVECELVPTDKVKYVMTAAGYVVVDGACRTWKPRDDAEPSPGFKKAIADFIQNFRTGKI